MSLSASVSSTGIRAPKENKHQLINSSIAISVFLSFMAVFDVEGRQAGELEHWITTPSSVRNRKNSFTVDTCKDGPVLGYTASPSSRIYTCSSDYSSAW
ncbi:hypothetical protein ILYODFUR_024336 [Ilyodon furcidens]|uniref:Uncharacterized protein n=1 Tax=Ilyodon furcidens TaxID=33524 RepID=A0ABV0UUS4_9TELE